MSASGPLRERDLRALKAVVEDGLRDDPGQAMPWVVLDGLLRLVPSQTVGFNEIDMRKQWMVTRQYLEEGGKRRIETFARKQEPPYPEYWTHRQGFLPSRYADRSGDLTRVFRTSDFYAASELRNVPFYTEYVRPMFGIHNMYVPLPAGPGRIRRILLDRGSGPDFGERDLLILRLLRPHLHEVFLDAERRRHGISELSPREREVLQLVGQGYSNAEVAKVLFISVATVRKHMEHIFDRIGVRTRTGAAAVMLPHLILGGRPRSPG